MSVAATSLKAIDGGAAPEAVVPPVNRLPQKGADFEALLEQMHGLRHEDAHWREGRCFALVYSAGEDHHTFLAQAHNVFFSENGLNPMAFKSLKRMEAEVVRMTHGLQHAPSEAVGVMTSGGTESILLAVKTYRDMARKRRPWIRKPEMVLPKTAHVAFEKAGHYFGVKIRYAPVTEDFRVDVKAVKKLINRNTIMLMGSAPQYPHGVIDPIAELGELALKKKLPLHVDACVGGFLLPFIERLGHKVPSWDYRAAGVTSISADLHKYGYCAKGASVLTYRSMDTMKHQFFVSTDWPGGVFASPGVPGTRPGGPIAAAWAGMQAMGEDGYMRLAERALGATDKLRAGIDTIDGLCLYGEGPATVVTFGSSDKNLDVYAVADQLGDKGWHFDRQQHPASVHLTVMSAHLDTADEFIADLRAAVAAVKADPELKSRGNAAMYGMMARIPMRTMVKSAVQKVMEGMYGPDGEVPDLSEPGAAGDGVVGKVMDRFGGVAMQAFERFDEVKSRFGMGGPR